MSWQVFLKNAHRQSYTYLRFGLLELLACSVGHLLTLGGTLPCQLAHLAGSLVCFGGCSTQIPLRRADGRADVCLGRVSVRWGLLGGGRLGSIDICTSIASAKRFFASHWRLDWTTGLTLLCTA